ncbi:MAG: hypothetical protein HY925_08925, partial [Elusimicrobia bacterium]|nr:hypothetical protein [Elusimicrobiota bacterium]
MIPARHRAAAFLASFLAFQLELSTAKLLLPRYGGGAYVWTTAVAVFQGLVLAAALYAVWLRRTRFRYPVHLAVAAACGASALAPSGAAGAAHPAAALALDLLAAAGPAFFALSSVTAVLDDWLGEPDARGLYAASNLGALCALLAFPLLLEPALPLELQGRLWRGLYAGWVVLVASCRPGERERPSVPGGSDGAFGWALAAAAPSAALVAATNALGL